VAVDVDNPESLKSVRRRNGHLRLSD
jgi:hypothetical protein